MPVCYSPSCTPAVASSVTLAPPPAWIVRAPLLLDAHCHRCRCCKHSLAERTSLSCPNLALLLDLYVRRLEDELNETSPRTREQGLILWIRHSPWIYQRIFSMPSRHRTPHRNRDSRLAASTLNDHPIHRDFLAHFLMRILPPRTSQQQAVQTMAMITRPTSQLPRILTPVRVRTTCNPTTSKTSETASTHSSKARPTWTMAGQLYVECPL